MQDQEQRNALISGNVGHCGDVEKLRRVVAELLSVAERRLGLAMYPTTSLPRLDDGRYVVGVPVDGHAAFDDRQRQPVGLQVTTKLTCLGGSGSDESPVAVHGRPCPGWCFAR
jgi:hypothetical protein